jgi:hypothetical protein
MSLPSSFSYFANRLGGVTRRTVKVSPNNSTTVKQSQSIEAVMPSNAIVDLTSLRMSADFKYQNATSATNAIRYVPQPHACLRSATWALNGNTVAGAQNQFHGQVYEMIRRSCSGDSRVKSREDEYTDVPVANLLGAVTDKQFGSGNERAASDTQARRVILAEFLGLQTSPNAPNWDTALTGDCRLTLQLNGPEVCMGQADSAFASDDFDWQWENVEFLVDVISFADPTYDQLMSAMLAEPEAALLIPFNEITSQKSLLNSNIRFNVASQSLDMLMFAPLHADHTGATTISSSSGVPPAGLGTLVPKHVQFSYRTAAGALASAAAGMSDSAKDATFFWTLNGQVMPAKGATSILDGAEFTKELYAAGKDDTNQLFMGYSAQAAPIDAGTIPASGTAVYPGSLNKEVAKTYARVNYLDYNAVVAMRTCLDVPAAQSETRTLSGVNTLGGSSQCSLSLQGGWYNNNDSAILAGQGSAIMSVGAGQVVSVVY